MKKMNLSFLLTSVALTIATAILTYIVQNYELIVFDDGVYNWFNSWWIASLNPVMAFITALSHTKISFILTVLAGILLLYKKLYYLCFLLMNSMGGGVVITYLMKSNIARERPGDISYMNIWGLFTNIVSYSFPSGHAVKALLYFGVLIYAIHLELKHKGLKKWLICGLSIITILIGVGQVLLDKHFVSDIIGGYLVALAWLTFCLAVTEPFLNWIWGKFPQGVKIKIEEKLKVS